MLKKLLTMILSLIVLITIPINVLACGPVTTQKLLNRKVDTNIFKTYYSASPTTWNPVATMQTNDILLLANLHDTLLENNRDGDLIPDLLTDIGSLSDDSTTYSFTFRDDAAFFDELGTKVKAIDGKDFLNTAMYVLNPMNVSQVISTWTSVVFNAQTVSDIYQLDHEQNQNKSAYDVSNNPQALMLLEEAIIIDEDNPKTVSLKLAQPTPYFRSYLTSFAFSPTPTKALFASYNYGIKAKEVWTTGPYLIKSYQTSYLLKLVKNPAYFAVNQVFINQIWFQFLANLDIARPRLLFETGDYSEVWLQPSDHYGWKKYVGTDFNHPKFSGLTNILNPTLGTRYLSFNFFNTETALDNEKYQGRNNIKYQQGVESNFALSLDSVRTLIAFAMNRSLFVRYFSEPFDNGLPYSKFLRNTFNPGGHLKGNDGLDYQDYLQDAYNQLFNSTAVSLVDGQEIFYQNSQLLSPSGNEIITDVTARSLLAQAKPFEALIQQVRSDLTGSGYEKGVSLTMLMSGVYNSTWNIYLQDMIDTFNVITNNLVKINAKRTMNDSDYQASQLQGNFSMFLTGWGPGFLDPLAFLRTYIIQGDMANYFGLSRIINQVNFNKQNQTSLDQLVINSNYLNSFLDQNYAYKLLAHFVDYTNQVNAADQITDSAQKTIRYQQFATAEANLLYSYKLLMPFYVPDGTTKTLLTYIDESTRSHVGFGNSDKRYVGVKMLHSLKEVKINLLSVIEVNIVLNNKEN